MMKQQFICDRKPKARPENVISESRISNYISDRQGWSDLNMTDPVNL